MWCNPCGVNPIVWATRRVPTIPAALGSLVVEKTCCDRKNSRTTQSLNFARLSPVPVGDLQKGVCFHYNPPCMVSTGRSSSGWPPSRNGFSTLLRIKQPMSDSPEPAKPRRTVRSIAAAVGLRVALAMVLAAVLFAVFGDIGAVLPSRPVGSQGPEAAMPVDVDKPADPGWPHRRGPHYDAISDETNLADAWPPEGPLVLWTRDLGRSWA